MNTKIIIVLIALVLYVKYSADSEKLTRKKIVIGNRYNKRKLLESYTHSSCEPGKKRYRGKCLTYKQIQFMKDNGNSDDDNDTTTTNVTPTPNGDDDNKTVTNATNPTNTGSTSKTNKSKEIDTISTTPIPSGDSNDKRETNIMNITSTESTQSKSTMPDEEHDNTYPTNRPKLLDGDEVQTTSMPNGVLNNSIIAIAAFFGLALLIFCVWCLYKTNLIRHIQNIITEYIPVETQRN